MFKIHRYLIQIATVKMGKSVSGACALTHPRGLLMIKMTRATIVSIVSMEATASIQLKMQTNVTLLVSRFSVLKGTRVTAGSVSRMRISRTPAQILPQKLITMLKTIVPYSLL